MTVAAQWAEVQVRALSFAIVLLSFTVLLLLFLLSFRCSFCCPFAVFDCLSAVFLYRRLMRAGHLMGEARPTVRSLGLGYFSDRESSRICHNAENPSRHRTHLRATSGVAARAAWRLSSAWCIWGVAATAQARRARLVFGLVMRRMRRSGGGTLARNRRSWSDLMLFIDLSTPLLDLSLPLVYLFAVFLALPLSFCCPFAAFP